MRIGIDIDNVIADLDKTFLEEFEKEDKNKRNKGIINKKAKHITEGMFDWSSEEIEDFICNNMDRMAEKFDLIEDAKEYINKLYFIIFLLVTCSIFHCEFLNISLTRWIVTISLFEFNPFLQCSSHSIC